MGKKRAAAYARVSTSRKSQEHSYEFQSAYWAETLGNSAEYEYVGIFADKGISGKFANRRPQFLAMVDACRKGMIDIIFTKSVQRFSRNTEELLTMVHELREIGVAVVFEKEGINTLDPNSELFLTIAAAVAEDDLSRYSQSVVWSIVDKFQKGENVMGHSLYGYYVIKNRDLVINPDEALVVREIFEQFDQGIKPNAIAKELNSRGLPSPRGSLWNDSQIRAMLANEKYCGDLLLQKTYTDNGTKRTNRGERAQYYVENNHEPIVSRELWQRVQERLARQANPKLQGRTQKTYPFTGMIICGKCGHNVTHKVNNTGTPHQADFWKCHHSIKHGKAVCDNPGIKDTVLKEKFIEAYNEFVTMGYKGEEDGRIAETLSKLYAEEKELIQLSARGWISKSDYETEHRAIREQIVRLERQAEEIRIAAISSSDCKAITEFDEEKLHRFVKKVTLRDWVVTFEFYNGVTVSRDYTNGQHGNIQDWVREHRKRRKS